MTKTETTGTKADTVQTAPSRHTRRYSRWVDRMKLILPSAAAMLIGMVVLWPQVGREAEGFALAVQAPLPSGVERLRVDNPRLFGTDDDNQPYAITAQAVEEHTAGAAVDLIEPKADIALHDGAWLAAAARSGVFMKDDEVLRLSGDVTLLHDEGYEILTDTVDVDVRTGTADGNAPLWAQGPFGELQAAGLALNHPGRKITFKGPVTARMAAQADTPQ